MRESTLAEGMQGKTPCQDSGKGRNPVGGSADLRKAWPPEGHNHPEKAKTHSNVTQIEELGITK